jgi:hypothetical protein
MGALTKEYFSNGHDAILRERYQGRFAVFEGDDDHKLPSHDAMLLRSGIFQAVGKFIAHSYIHTGVAMVGLCNAAVQYLCTESVDNDTPFEILLDDIPLMEVRSLLQKVSFIYYRSI